MENSNNKKNNFLDSLKEIFHYFEYYIVDSNTVLHAPLWGNHKTKNFHKIHNYKNEKTFKVLLK